jgi:hypothetical protein
VFPASGERRGETRSADSAPTIKAGYALWQNMKRGEATSLSLLASLSPDQHERQLTAEARLLTDVLMTHLARIDRETALDFLADLLDEHRRRVLPELRDTRTLSLFGGNR